MTTPQSDIKLGPDPGDVEGNAQGWGWVGKGGSRGWRRCFSVREEPPLQQSLSCGGWSQNSLGFLLTPFFITCLLLSFLVDQRILLAKAWRLFSVSYGQNKTIFTERTYRFWLRLTLSHPSRRNLLCFLLRDFVTCRCMHVYSRNAVRTGLCVH